MTAQFYTISEEKFQRFFDQGKNLEENYRLIHLLFLSWQI